MFFWVFDQKLQICHPTTPHFGIFDRKWQICLENNFFSPQISIQIYEKLQFFSNFVTERSWWLTMVNHANYADHGWTYGQVTMVDHGQPWLTMV